MSEGPGRGQWPAVSRLVDLVAPGDPSADRSPGLAWATFAGGRVTGSGGLGVARFRADREPGAPGDTPMRADTKVRVASISKIGVAVAAHRLAADGKLDLDADISDLLGFAVRNPAHADAQITLAQLLSHISSLRDGEVYWSRIGEKLSDFLTPGASRWEAGRFAAHAPGAAFAYCNLGYGVIGTLIEAAAGLRFDHAMHEHVLAPLRIDGGYNWSGVSDADVAASAACYRLSKGAWALQTDGLESLKVRPTALGVGPAGVPDGPVGVNAVILNPQGGLRASALDLALLGADLASGKSRLLPQASIDRLCDPVWRLKPGGGDDTQGGFFQAFGLGLQTLTGVPGGDGAILGQTRPLVGHFGDAYGLKGALLWDRETTRGFAYLLNGTPADPRPASRAAMAQLEQDALQILHDWAICEGQCPPSSF